MKQAREATKRERTAKKKNGGKLGRLYETEINSTSTQTSQTCSAWNIETFEKPIPQSHFSVLIPLRESGGNAGPNLRLDLKRRVQITTD